MPILGLMLAGAAAAGAPGGTDFGIREVGYRVAPGPLPTVEVSRARQESRPLAGARDPLVRGLGRADLSGAVALAAQWGRVTSTTRSPEHNRRVGGVANSYHLSGRAIDIARRPGVAHWQIDAALRRAGYRLVESLDEGDHSHFAFSWGAEWRPLATVASATRSAAAADGTRWRVVYAPR